MTEFEKMLNGEMYFADEENLLNKRILARKLLYDFNNSIDEVIRAEILKIYWEKWVKIVLLLLISIVITV